MQDREPRQKGERTIDARHQEATEQTRKKNMTIKRLTDLISRKWFFLFHFGEIPRDHEVACACDDPLLIDVISCVEVCLGEGNATNAILSQSLRTKSELDGSGLREKEEKAKQKKRWVTHTHTHIQTHTKSQNFPLRLNLQKQSCSIMFLLCSCYVVFEWSWWLTLSVYVKYKDTNWKERHRVLSFHIDLLFLLVSWHVWMQLISVLCGLLTRCWRGADSGLWSQAASDRLPWHRYRWWDLTKKTNAQRHRQKDETMLDHILLLPPPHHHHHRHHHHHHHHHHHLILLLSLLLCCSSCCCIPPSPGKRVLALLPKSSKKRMSPFSPHTATKPSPVDVAWLNPGAFW